MINGGIDMIARRILFVIMAICFALMPQSVLAQRKIAVEVIHSGQDSVGARLAYQVKEDIRRSAGLRLTNIDESRLILHLLTDDASMGGNGPTPGSSTIFSYTITWKNDGDLPEMFISSGQGVCGGKRLNDSAEELVAVIDSSYKRVP
jgi:hypothetical protein